MMKTDITSSVKKKQTNTVLIQTGVQEHWSSPVVTPMITDAHAISDTYTGLLCGDFAYI